jgi:hypothetical protein
MIFRIGNILVSILTGSPSKLEFPAKSIFDMIDP